MIAQGAYPVYNHGAIGRKPARGGIGKTAKVGVEPNFIQLLPSFSCGFRRKTFLFALKVGENP